MTTNQFPARSFIFRLVLSTILFRACESENDDVCATRVCASESENVLAKLDETVMPCEDFYRFACGTFLNETKIPDDKTSVDVGTILDDKLKEQLNEILNSSITSDDIKPFANVKKLYKACLNEGELK